MIYDSLFVLAKEGVYVFSGRPQNLRKHLNECHIVCNQNQIPIEVLMKIGGKGYSDESVVKLSNKTSQDFIPQKFQLISLRILTYCFIKIKILYK